ncbi:MAG: hypothetical protein LBV17_09260 [Treponema sp.]|jgi:hypothetical protein|nr:hypothetical protein [Treponema sp.]
MKGIRVFLFFIMVLIVLVACSNKEETIKKDKKSINAIVGESSKNKEVINTIIKEPSPSPISLIDKLNLFSEKTFDGHEVFLSDKITEYENNYLYFYGKTEDEIVKRFGNQYEIKDESDFYSTYGYKSVKKIIYPGMEFDILKSDRVLKLVVWQAGLKYYGDIKIGCDLDVIIKQLGKPNRQRELLDNYLWYDVAGNFQIVFEIDENFALKEIAVYEDLI